MISGKKQNECLYEDCVCSKEKKVINYDTYISQLFNRNLEIVLTEEDKLKFGTIVSGDIFISYILF